jgi:hypothetical protein
MYNSKTKNKLMDESDMHMMHIENVLLKDLKEGTLSWGGTNRLTAAYIGKVKADRKRLHNLLKTSANLNQLLFDILRAPATRKKHLSKPLALALESYRLVALGYLRKHGQISADTLRSVLIDNGYKVSGQLLTHVFRDKRFVQSHYRRSEWGKANGRYINIWQAA